MENKVLEKFETPFYVFDINTLHDRIDYLQNKLDNIDLCYAVKANPFIIHEVIPKVKRLEICSEGEYDICQKLGVPSNVMVISGVNKSLSYIKKLVDKNNDFIFTIESMHQFEMIKTLAHEYKSVLKIMPRLTSGNQFGINNDEVINVINTINNDEYLELIGIEYFSGTQKYSLKKTEREFNTLKELFNEIEEKCNYKITELEYGSGFPVEYFNENKFNEEEFIEEFNNLVKTYFSDIKFTMELGRSIASSCGKYYTRVVDMKNNDVGNFAIVDGGMNHLVYYGQTMAMKYPEYEIIPNRGTDNVENWNICGSLCTINDIIVKQLPISDLKINDCFVFKNTGAYSMCEGISLFLSRDLPKIILKDNDDYKIVRDVFKTSDLNTPNI